MSIGKVCKNCNVLKSFDLYHKHPNTKDGTKNICKDCCSKSIKEYKLKNVPGYKESNLNRVRLRSSDPNKKICSMCEIEKNLSEFRYRKYGRNNHLYGPISQCLSCESEYELIYNGKMRGKRPPKTKEQRLKNFEYMKQKKLKDPEYREKCLTRARILKNSEKYKEKTRIQRKKWLENPTNKIAKNMRSRMRCALKGLSKKESTLNMTGIPFEELKKYLESKFREGMSWENYGVKGWHIDHIIPCNYFDFTNADHQKICFYYKNLQPLWAGENISKLNRITVDNIEDFINDIKKELNIF
jgi:hypothetical protein